MEEKMKKLVINPDRKCSKINKEIYGHFSEHLGRGIYEGLFVGKDSPIKNVNGMRCDVVEALREIKVPVLRWPGGCFADEYHWMDGVGPLEGRKKMINTHWGGVVEDNSFGRHEFFELCSQLGCESYINGNLGSGTVREMSEWVEYMTFDGVSPMAQLREQNGHRAPWKVDFFGVGNENWGCGGNMNPEFYANEYRRYQTYVRDYNADHKIQKVACGSNGDDYSWTREVLKTCYNHSDPNGNGFMNGLSLHYYVVPNGWTGSKGSATDFDVNDWYKTLNKTWYMDELVRRHGNIMDEYDPKKQIGMIVDEWGAWYDCEPGTNPGFLYQQNTIRDALVAGVTLNIFNKHSDRVRMANIAQMINVLQSVILTDGEKMIKTPTWHIFDMYKVHQDAQLVESSIETQEIGTEEYKVPDVTESVSEDAEGRLHITLTNLSADQAVGIETVLTDHKVTSVTGEIVTGSMLEKNTFEEPDRIVKKAFDAVKVENGSFTFTLPACSVLHLTVVR